MRFCKYVIFFVFLTFLSCKSRTEAEVWGKYEGKKYRVWDIINMICYIPNMER